MHQIVEDSVSRRAYAINQDDSIYGTFAEIGAGQEVARIFFQAGRASHTIAKTISAYDMTFSDAIYGKDSRYVSESRLHKMLDHEYSLLEERLNSKRGQQSRFFAFANTATTSSRTSPDETSSHGWLGLRFQMKPMGPVNNIILHVRLWDKARLEQQEAFGHIGVNLIYSAFHQTESPTQFVGSLIAGLGAERVEVDMIRVSGPDLGHFDARLTALELVSQRLTKTIAFTPSGDVSLISEILYGKPVVVYRGSFRPVTLTNLDILEKSVAQKKLDGVDPNRLVVLWEMTMQNLMADGFINKKDFLDRVDSLGALGYPMLVSNFSLFYELKSYLRTCTNDEISIVMGASHLQALFEERHYDKLKGGILEGLARLLDHRTQILVYPFKVFDVCQTASTFHPDAHLDPLFQYLLGTNRVRDISGCDDVINSVHSREVSLLLKNQDPAWEAFVPKPVRDKIKAQGLFANGK